METLCPSSPRVTRTGELERVSTPREHRVGHVKAAQPAPEEGEGLAQRLGHVGRQTGAHLAPGDAAGVGGRDASAGRAGHALDEVAHELGRRDVGPAARGIGRPLARPLQLHAGERVVAGQVVGKDVGQQAGVGVCASAVREAHAVGADAAGLACRRDHVASGTHAEREGASPGGEVAGEAVGRGAEGGMSRGPGHRAPGRCPPGGARCARAHRKGLALQGDAAPAQELKDVARRVPAGEHHAARGHALLAGRAVRPVLGERDRADRAVRDVEVGHAAATAHLAARRPRSGGRSRSPRAAARRCPREAWRPRESPAGRRRPRTSPG